MSENDSLLVLNGFLHEIMKALCIYLTRTLPQIDREWWVNCVIDKLPSQQRSELIKNGTKSLEGLDLSKLLQIASNNWSAIKIAKVIPREKADPAADYIRETITIRNRRQGHPTGDIGPDDLYYRDLDTLGRVAELIEADNRLIQKIRSAKDKLLMKMADSIRSAVKNSQPVKARKQTEKGIVKMQKPRTVDRLLVEASKAGDIAEISTLLSHDANIDTPACGTKPLIEAIIRGKKETTQFLLDKGADVNVLGNNTTPLLEAIKKGDHDLIKLLFNKKADPNVRGGDTTVLVEAIRKDDQKLIELLFIKKADPNIRGGDGTTPLLEAVRKDDHELVKRLLAMGADVNSADNSGQTPLMLAAKRGRSEIVRSLLYNNPDVDAMAKNGFSAIMEAIGNHRIEVVKLLQSVDAIVPRTKNGWKKSATSSEISVMSLPSSNGRVLRCRDVV